MTHSDPTKLLREAAWAMARLAGLTPDNTPETEAEDPGLNHNQDGPDQCGRTGQGLSPQS